MSKMVGNRAVKYYYNMGRNTMSASIEIMKILVDTMKTKDGLEKIDREITDSEPADCLAVTGVDCPEQR